MGRLDAYRAKRLPNHTAEPATATHITAKSRTEARDIIFSRSPDVEDPGTKFSRHFKTNVKLQKEHDAIKWSCMFKMNISIKAAAVTLAMSQGKDASVIAAILHEEPNIKLGSFIEVAVSNREVNTLRVLLDPKSQQEQNQPTPSQVPDVCLARSLERLSNEQPDWRPQSLSIVKALCVAGARLLPRQFEEAIERKDMELVDIFLRTPSGQRLELHNLLLHCVTNSNYEALAKLLAYGADPSLCLGQPPSSIPLFVAISKRDFRYAFALVKHGPRRPDRDCTSEAIRSVLSNIPANEDFRWLALLLEEGCDRDIPELVERLFKAMQMQQLEHIRLIVSSGLPIQPYDGLPLCAISQGDISVVRALFHKFLPISGLEVALCETIRAFQNHDEAVEACSLLLQAGATGPPVNDFLVTVTQILLDTYGSERPSATKIKLLTTLIRGGASIEWRDGHALKRAFRFGNVYVLDGLLIGAPSCELVSSLLSSLFNLRAETTPEKRLELASRICSRNASQDSLNEALFQVVKQNPTHHNLMQFFLDKGADVHHSDWRVMKSAFELCSIEIVNLLFASVHLERALISAFLDNALVVECEKAAPNHEIIDFVLMSGASVDYQDGRALHLVCQKRDITAAELILNKSPRQTIVSNIMATVIGDPTIDSSDCMIMLQLLTPKVGAFINEQLVLAVTEKHLSSDDRCRIIEYLIGQGADVNYNNGMALRSAALIPTMDRLRTLKKGPPRSATKATANFQEVKAHFERSKECMKVLEILLSQERRFLAEISDVFLDCATHLVPYQPLCNLLLDEGASVDHRDGEAIVQSIKNRNIDFLCFLLDREPRPSKTTLLRAVSFAYSTHPDARHQYVSVILAKSPSDLELEVVLDKACADKDFDMVNTILTKSSPPPDTCSKILTSCVHSDPTHQKLWKLLIEKGGSVDYVDLSVENSCALVQALKVGNLQFVKFLLSHRPRTEILNHGVLYASQGMDGTIRLEAMKLILDARQEDLDLRTAGTQAVRDEDVDLVRLLLDHGGFKEMTHDVVHAALSLGRQPRRDMIDLALNAGAQRSNMDEAVHAAIAEEDLDLLQLILTHSLCKPSQKTLSAILTKSLKLRSQFRKDVVRLALDAGAQGSSVDQALNTSVIEEDLDLMQLILSYDKPLGPESVHGILRAAVKERPDVLEPLLKNFSGPTPVLSRVMEEITSLGTFANFSGGFICAKLLLEKGLDKKTIEYSLTAAVSSDAPQHTKSAYVTSLLSYHTPVGEASSKAIHWAATTGESSIFSILSKGRHPLSSSILSSTLKQMTSQRTVPLVQGGLDCAKLLLQRKIAQHVKDKALISAVSDTWTSDQHRDEYVNALLAAGANVNAEDGRSLKQAASATNSEGLLTALLRHGAKPRSVVEAVPEFLKSSKPEDKLLPVLQEMMGYMDQATIAESAEDFGSDNSVIALCLRNYPESHRLLQEMLSYGFDAMATRKTVIDERIGEEDVSSLMFALTHPEDRYKVTKGVMDALLSHYNARDWMATSSARFVSSKTRATALTLVAEDDRDDIAEILLRRGASLDQLDWNGRTAMLVACENDSMETIKLLMKNHAPVNDGSLHTAARTLPLNIMNDLLASGHEPDYPSLFHEGRSALQELLLKAEPWSEDGIQEIKLKIKALQKAGADPFLKDGSSNRTALYFVLHNEMAVSMLKLYLDTLPWSSVLHEDQNLYVDETGATYSPTAYLKHCKAWKGEESTKTALLNLLYWRRCQDKYFAPLGLAQPKGMIGMPADIQQHEGYRRTRLSDLELEMTIRDRLHEQDLRHQLSRAEQLGQITQQRNLQHLTHQQNSHAMSIQQGREQEREQLQFRSERHLLDMRQDDERAQQALAARTADQSMERNHQQQMLQQNQAAAHSMANIEREMLREREQMQERDKRRHIELIGHQTHADRQRALGMMSVGAVMQGHIPSFSGSSSRMLSGP